MADVSLMAVPSEHDASTCANCGAELVADQRYCLACGHPVSPVRLAFLDVLNEQSTLPGRGLLAPGTIEMAPFAYGPAAQPGLGGWLRRNTGLLSLLAVLLLCLIAGLLVGHWVTQNGKSAPTGPQTLKIEGSLGGLAGSTTSSTSAAATHPRNRPRARAPPSKKKPKKPKKRRASKKRPRRRP